MAREIDQQPVEVLEFLPDEWEPPPTGGGVSASDLPSDRTSHTPSFGMRFLDRFLQEQNIKWILVAGILILLASSLKLVGTLWNESTVAWKHLIFLGYTAAFYALSQGAYWRLGLRKTGTVLMALAVMLVPMTFVGIHWVFAERGNQGLLLPRNLLLLAATAGLGWHAARTIFAHFLRAAQPTFIASYLFLCAAAAFVPAIPTTYWPVTTLILWSAFTIGTVKVNRHIFWMTEAYRLPRIFGFFPIALLGGQFVALFLWQVGSHVPRDWLGLILVMTAIPVALTADTVARVFQERTGDLVRPLPWSIIGPVALSLILCVAGMLFALTGLPFPSALVPTALLSALLVGIVAQRTGQRALVWGALGCVVLAYNFSYVFFLDVARYVLQAGASAVREQRLPLAFYGLTYVPLIAGLIGARAFLTRRAATTSVGTKLQALWAPPLTQFVAALCGVLLAASFTHPKALLPVGIVMCGAFLLQAFAFKRPGLAAPATAAYLAAIAGVTPFVTTVLQVPVVDDFGIFVWTIAAIVLLGPGRLIDRWTGRVAGLSRDAADVASRGKISLATFGWCRTGSLIVAFALASLQLLDLLLDGGANGFTLPMGSVMGVLFIHAIVAAHPALGLVALGYAGGVSYLHAAQLGIPLPVIADWSTGILLCLWLASYVMELRRESRLSRTFGDPCRGLGLIGLTLLALHALLTTSIGLLPAAHPTSWVMALALVAWCIDASRRTTWPHFVAIGAALLFVATGAMWKAHAGANFTWEWLTVAWSVLGSTMMLAGTQAHRRLLGEVNSSYPLKDNNAARWLAVVKPMQGVSLSVLATIGVVSLLWFSVPMRVAGSVATGGMLLYAVLTGRPELRRIACVGANWQGLALVPGFFVATGSSLFELSTHMLGLAAIPLSAAAGFSAFALQVIRGPVAGRNRNGMLDLHGAVMHLLVAGGLMFKAIEPVPALSPMDVSLSVLAFAAVIAEAIWRALDRKHEWRVWLAEGVAALGVVYFWRCGVIELGTGAAMFVVLAVGIIAWVAGEIVRRAPRLAVLSRPLNHTGTVLPLMAGAIGSFQAIRGDNSLWLGANSLALFLAAGFYFWQGIERHDKRFFVLSMGIVNLSLCFLWRELAFTDPQFFMIPIGLSIIGLVELLRREIPRGFHDLLRYTGALTILVSPTLHLVEGSWLHLISLMVAAVAVCLLAIGLQVRALMYTGTAFLIADLVAMVIRGGIDRPNILWIAGIAFGTLVVILGAVCEKHREDVLQRLRILSSRLESWN